jgi:hypothetical protein
MEIYILVDNKPAGPYTPELVRQYLASGKLGPTDLAAYAGRADWRPLSAMVQSWTQTSLGNGTRSSPAAVPPAKSAMRKSLVLIGAVALVLLVGATGFIFWRGREKTIWTATRVVTPAEPGWPNSYAELNTWYAEPPEGQNAATFFLKGLDAFQITDADRNSPDLPVLGRGRWPEPGAPLPPQTKAGIFAFVQRNDATWMALEQGVSFERARYPIDLNLGPATLLPHLGKIKKAVQFAQLKAALCADDHQSQAAADTMLVSLALAQSVKDEPILISQLVRVACFAIQTASLQDILNSVALSPADLARLSTAFAKVESVEVAGEGFSRALIGERASTEAFLDTPPDKMEEMLGKFGIDRPRNRTANELMQNVKAERAFAEETFNHVLAMRKEPFPQRLKVDEYFAFRANLAKNNQFYLCEMLLPAFGRVTKREAGGLANLRLARTAIALEQYRQANAGNYPSALAALVPTFLNKVPEDPFKGQPLFYQKNGDGYLLRCTGPDLARPLYIKVLTPPKPVL